MSVLSLVNKNILAVVCLMVLTNMRQQLNLKRIEKVYMPYKYQATKILSASVIKSKLAQYLVDLMVDVVAIDINIDSEELYRLLYEEFTLEELFYLRRAVLEYYEVDEADKSSLSAEDGVVLEQLKMMFLS